MTRSTPTSTGRQTISRHSLVDKLFILVNGKTSQGVKDYLNVDVIPKGAKFTLKQLQEIDLPEHQPQQVDD
ncbi:MAG: hypothetical protein MZV63_27645 [Marinilabiliales bacterium]|nr:hypothetical protein [Marinilabiliales bacterium]